MLAIFHFARELFVVLKFAVGQPILYAMMALYLLLTVASFGVGLCTTPDSQLRKQVNAWWLIFPVVSLSLLLYPAGPLLMALVIVVLAVRELAYHHVGPRWQVPAKQDAQSERFLRRRKLFRFVITGRQLRQYNPAGST